MAELWRFGFDEWISRTVPGDVESVAAHMREADRREVWASHELEPLEALRSSVERTPKPLTIWKGDRPAAIFGVVPVSAVFRTGIVWLLGTELIEKHPVPFLRHTKEVMEALQEEYVLLFNWVHEANRLSRRWLRWCGYEERDAMTGMHGDRFIRYELRKGGATCV